MFRTMRRSGQALPDGAVERVLNNADWGVLAVQGDDGWPYTVPLNYVREGDHLYFHSSRRGHKIDALARSDKASFCIVTRHDIDAPRLTTKFQSVIVFGRLSLVEDNEEKRRLIRLFTDRLAPGQDEAFDREMRTLYPAMHMLDLHMEHVTGKEERSMAEARRAGQAAE